MTLRVSQATASRDIVAILDANGNPILTPVRAISVNVVRNSKKFTHPLENNAVTTDYKIIEPVRVEFSAIIQSEDYQETYNELERIFLSSEFLMIQTKARTFDNMIVVNMPHKEDTTTFDALQISILFEETQIARVETVDINEDFSTVNRGQVQPQESSEQQTRQGSAAFDLIFG